MSQIVFQKETAQTSVSQTPSKQQRSFKIFVGGIPHKTAEADLLSHFNSFGEVAKVKIPVNKKNQKSRGFAFVEFKTEKSVLATLAEPIHRIKGKEVSVRRGMNSKKARKHTKSLQKRKLFIEGLDQLPQAKLQGLTEADFREFFERFGPVERVLLPRESSTRRLRGFLYVIMSDDQGFNSALGAKSRIYFKGVKLRIRESKSVREIKKDRASRQAERKVEEAPIMIARSSKESISGSLSHRSPAFDPRTFNQGRPLLTALSNTSEVPRLVEGWRRGVPSNNNNTNQNRFIRERRRMTVQQGSSESPSVECQDSCSRTDESDQLQESFSSVSSRWHPKSVSQSSYLASKFGLASETTSHNCQSRRGAPLLNRNNYQSRQRFTERGCYYSANNNQFNGWAGRSRVQDNRFEDYIDPSQLTGESLIQRHNLIFKPPQLAESLALPEPRRRSHQPFGENDSEFVADQTSSRSQPHQSGVENHRNQLPRPQQYLPSHEHDDTISGMGTQLVPQLGNREEEEEDTQNEQPNVEIRQIIKTEYKIRVEGYIYTGCITETNEWGTRQGEEENSPSEIGL